MSEHTVRVAAGSAIAPHLSAGAVICLGPGVHVESLSVEESVTLRGEPGAILDAGRRGPVIAVGVDGVVVRVETLTLRNGAGEAGGGVRLSGWSEVILDRCVVEGNEASLAGGGAGGGIYLHRGSLSLLDTDFRDNHARSGTDLHVTGAARAEARGGRFGGDIVVSEGAELTLVGSHVVGALSARGTTTRAPSVTLRGTRIDGGVVNDPNLPASVVVENG